MGGHAETRSRPGIPDGTGGNSAGVAREAALSDTKRCTGFEDGQCALEAVWHPRLARPGQRQDAVREAEMALTKRDAVDNRTGEETGGVRCLRERLHCAVSHERGRQPPVVVDYEHPHREDSTRFIMARGQADLMTVRLCGFKSSTSSRGSRAGPRSDRGRNRPPWPSATVARQEGRESADGCASRGGAPRWRDG